MSNSAIAEVTRFFEAKEAQALRTTPAHELLHELRRRLASPSELGADADGRAAASESVLEVVAERLQAAHDAAADSSSSSSDGEWFTFDPKYLFRVLVLANAQLAQLIQAKGPNMQTSAACAGTTQAISVAQDLLAQGRCERVVVIAGDTASSDTLLPWIGNGFRALGAACTKARVEEAALPFDLRRSGVLLGGGAVGLVLETPAALLARKELPRSPLATLSKVAAPSMHDVGAAGKAAVARCEVLATRCCNSAYHGVALDRAHIAQEMEAFLQQIEADLGLTKREIARQGVYLSHETGTHASSQTSCAFSEVSALREVFGEELPHLLILNTKGLTGHAMGVSFEDVVAAQVLTTGRVPPIPNWCEPDSALGRLSLSTGGKLSPPPRYALRFAAGFGSQVAFALYGRSA